MNEVYNNLAAAESALNQPAALDDFRKAFDGDPNDPIYAFNLGLSLLRHNEYDEAAKHLTAAAENDTSDDDAETLLALADDKIPFPPGTKSPVSVRLKLSFDATAFRELKAMLTK
jgi:tetratricopeptide (TPR) repeat protein